MRTCFWSSPRGKKRIPLYLVVLIVRWKSGVPIFISSVTSVVAAVDYSRAFIVRLAYTSTTQATWSGMTGHP